MSSISLLKDQLLSQGITHYVVLDVTGGVVDYSGDFACRETQRLAHTILQQSALLVSPCAAAAHGGNRDNDDHQQRCSDGGSDSDALRRVTMTLPDVAYTATTVVDSGTTYGVVVKRAHNNNSSLLCSAHD